MDEKSFERENEKRVAEILEYYAQYEKELAAGGYKDPDDENLLRTDEDRTGKAASLNLARGKTGVFDLGDLVELLRSEKALDVCCIEMPKEIVYARHMLICTAMSLRHSKALCERVREVYKWKKAPYDPFIERPEKNLEWAALDLGNIVVHVMTEGQRRKYDIETLWAVGAEFDDLTVAKTSVDRLADEFRTAQTEMEWLKNVRVANSESSPVQAAKSS